MRRLDYLTGLLSDERGGTSLEYAMIAVAIAVVAVAGFTAIGHNLSNMLSTVSGGV